MRYNLVFNRKSPTSGIYQNFNQKFWYIPEVYQTRRRLANFWYGASHTRSVPEVASLGGHTTPRLAAPRPHAPTTPRPHSHSPTGPQRRSTVAPRLRGPAAPGPCGHTARPPHSYTAPRQMYAICLKTMKNTSKCFINRF